MRECQYGWRTEEGFNIPFLGVIFRHPAVYYLTVGPGVPPKHICGLQQANQTAYHRFNFTISRRFEEITRKTYICADLLALQRFMTGYKNELVERTRKRTIDVAFGDFLTYFPAFSHAHTFAWPIPRGPAAAPTPPVVLVTAVPPPNA
ncbi:predicted protein [Sclerotinia sclerotiorum 1980 UF-70]|uniref:Uncharacterized protein n=2 Tax=Sclerotinia sclerotiorum (strain ATCC 18683 / 1980 / Ss-1) TaxID=665079 RepID=A7EUX8_SCLS1|nr:predicted protein [Sclerotinia sclerotiorum 1980 UF-70]APA15452.1 hypothetical protein sscle_14g102220 [Sclerotinia sclerotiorum 1980 UF-70]EDN93270.1 predicted protein [Sclerotinia sclerotiorum 1980 UF-70]